MFADMMRWGASPLPQGFDNRYFWGHPMMGWAGVNPATFWFVWILWVITWVLVIIVLIALIRWLWKKGDKGK